MRATEVLVIGAGPAGLTMANILARQGVPFRIIDKKGGPVRESRALVMHAKTLELLDRLGLADRAVKWGQRMGAIQVFGEGRPAGEISFFDADADDRTPYPFALVLEQDRTERLLIGGLEEAGGGVEWETELVSLAPTSDGVRATVKSGDGEEETVEVGWVVGADGAGSPVRHYLGLGFEGDTYEQQLFLADVEMDWAHGSRQVSIDITRAGFYAFFPMPGERRFRLIGGVPEELEGKEHITAEDVQRVLDRHSGWKTRITGVNWSSVYRTHRRMTERFRVGRVFLVGDAAHIHSPAGGQGMNTGIGDAYNLGWKLALVAKGLARASLLDSYEPERMPFARSILNGTDRAFLLQVTTDTAAQRLKILFTPLLFRIASMLPPIRRRAFWFVSQLWTDYRDSPAVARSGPAGEGPQPGERAPYGFLATGGDAGRSIFEEIHGLDHDLLLFEGGRSDTGLPDTVRTGEDLQALAGAYGAPIRLHVIAPGNRSLHERYGMEAPTLVLVRPDGHIAYRGPAGDLNGLAAYLDRYFVGPQGREEVRRTSKGATRVR
ncbi:MAG TPA: FAD-dependent monooxygenase [Rubrobacter sp.]|nr:FAD-dependent monooxygenase [Rubrobacter sp.]